MIMSIAGCGLNLFAADGSDSTLLANVRQLHEAARYVEAGVILQNAVATEPDNQKLSLNYGLNLRYQGRYAEAEQELKRTIELQPLTLQAEQANFLLAKSQFLGGNREAALATIASMKEVFPDSGWLPQAWVLEAEIRGGNVSEAQAKLDKQNAAETIYKRLMAERSAAGTTATANALRDLANNNKGLPIELTARDALGHVLIDETAAATEVFESLLADVQRMAPRSRIVQQANDRLGALYHRAGKPESALEHYNASIKLDVNKALSERAALQAAGIAFELVQRRLQKGEALPTEQWEELLYLLGEAKKDTPTTYTRIRVDLMEMETYIWRQDSAKAMECGLQFFSNYHQDEDQYRQEVATAYVGLARLAKEQQEYDRCRTFAEAALDLYPEEKEIWPRMDHIPRAYFDLIEALYSMGETQTADEKLAEFQERFPGSDYIRAIELTKKTPRYGKNLRDYTAKGRH